MAEIAAFRKNKIELSEYDYSQDIHNRVLMAHFTPLDIEVLEEILYSSLRIPLSLLQQNLDLCIDELTDHLEKLKSTKLFSINEDHVIVDKEMRKYYETQILKFEEDFKPGMEFLQSLLKKVPIHVLPSWYSISRTSNNIFESIVEKYLYTPQIYHRYLMDLSFSDPIQTEIMEALFQSPNLQIEAGVILEKYDLTQEQFEEHMLILEFSFIACVHYVRDGRHYKEVITPFQEWKDYLGAHKVCAPPTIKDQNGVKRKKSSDFSMIEEMSAILELALKSPIADEEKIHMAVKKTCPEFNSNDFNYLVEKLVDLNLADIQDDKVVCTSDSVDFLKMQLIDRAIFLYRHPLNSLEHEDVPEELCTQRTVREAEKSIKTVLDTGWVYLDEFLDKVSVPLNESQEIALKRIGRTWKYQFPEYDGKELKFFKAMIQQWLYEIGITALGEKEGRECFCVTPFGKELFGNE